MAMISRKSVIAVWTPLTVVSRSLLMSLIITFMFEPAKLQMNCASASGRRTFRRARDGRPLAVPGSTMLHQPPKVGGLSASAACPSPGDPTSSAAHDARHREPADGGGMADYP